jgi:hypothetical protein
MVPSDEHYTYDKPVRLNSHGFRGAEIREKHESEYRILVIGDSHVYGQGVGDRELMTTHLEDRLNETDPTCRFRVINMGVRAFSINNEYTLLEKTGLNLKPNHVLLYFYVNDLEPVDVEDRYRRFRSFDWYMFDLSSKPTGDVVVSWNRLQYVRKSASLMWAHDIYQAWRNRDDLVNRILRGETDDEVRERFRFAAEQLTRFHELSRRNEFRLTLFLIPVAAQIGSNFSGSVYPSKMIDQAKRMALDHHDLLPDFRAHYVPHGVLPVIPFDGHYDEVGHRIMAEATLRHLRDSKAGCAGKDDGVSILIPDQLGISKEGAT